MAPQGPEAVRRIRLLKAEEMEMLAVDVHQMMHATVSLSLLVASSVF